MTRELARVERVRADRHRVPYTASAAQADADRKALRPQRRKLAQNLPLRRAVQNRLKMNHSPKQIARRLVVDFPDMPQMRISPETIYKSIYVQGRGGLKRELAKHLRTGRSIRKPRRTPDQRPSRFPGGE